MRPWELITLYVTGLAAIVYASHKGLAEWGYLGLIAIFIVAGYHGGRVKRREEKGRRK